MCLSLSCVWLFATLWTVACQSPLSMEFSRQEYWSGSPFPSPDDLHDPGIKTASPALADGFFIIAPLGKPPEQDWVTQRCLTLCDPVDCSPQALLSMGSSRQEYWSGSPFTSPEDLPDPGIKPWSPALQAGSLPSEPPEKPLVWEILPDLPSFFGISNSTLLGLSFCSRSPLLLLFCQLFKCWSSWFS